MRHIFAFCNRYLVQGCIMEALPVISKFSVFAFMAGWLFTLVEWIGTQCFVYWVYRIGLRVLLIEEEIECPPALEKTIIVRETENLAYKVVEERLCLFRRKFRMFRQQSPLSIKGMVSWRAGKLTISGRYPLGGIVCMLAWLVGWTVTGLQGPLMGEPFVAPLLVGWVGGGGMFAYWCFGGLIRKDDLMNLKRVLMREP